MSDHDHHRRRPFISLRGVEKNFGDKHVLRGVNLEVMEGETVVVLGASGEGKTVLLRHINGLERPDAGEVWADGKHLNALSEDQLFPIRRDIAMVFQLGALFDSLSVFGNVSYPIREHGERDEERIRHRVHEVLQMVELNGDVENLFPAELSGGMKKRVALARALALEPKAVLYDEPTTGLDPIVTHKINQMIRGLQPSSDLPRWW